MAFARILHLTMTPDGRLMWGTDQVLWSTDHLLWS